MFNPETGEFLPWPMCIVFMYPYYTLGMLANQPRNLFPQTPNLQNGLAYHNSPNNVQSGRSPYKPCKHWKEIIMNNFHVLAIYIQTQNLHVNFQFGNSYFDDILATINHKLYQNYILLSTLPGSNIRPLRIVLTQENGKYVCKNIAPGPWRMSHKSGAHMAAKS